MTRPRRELVSVQDTPYYHIVSRCVRRAYLCGIDETTQTNYEYRRQWIVDRIRILSSLFAIDIAAYAVMSNHYHIVIKIDPSQLEALEDSEIIRRWTCLFKGPLIIQQLKKQGHVASVHQQTVDDIVKVWRTRLADLGWFMKCLNEPIARRANKEDNCTGHFWEARYKSQALRTDEALLACMAYVDLNPIRAKMAETPEESAHTSVEERINPKFCIRTASIDQLASNDVEAMIPICKPLCPFREPLDQYARQLLPCSYSEYIQLVDWAGRIIRPDKRGAIPRQLPSIFQRLRLPPDGWLQHAIEFERYARMKFLLSA